MKYCIKGHSNPDEANFCRICGTQSFVPQDGHRTGAEENEFEEPETTSSFTPDLYPDIVFKPESVTKPDFSDLSIWPVFMLIPLFICLVLSFATGGAGFIFFTVVFSVAELLLIIRFSNLKSTYRQNTEYIEDGEFLDGTRRIAKNGKLGLINQSNKVLLESDYTQISVFDGSILLIKTEGKYGLYNLSDKSFALSPKYDRISHFDNPYLLIESEGKLGVFNMNRSTIPVPVKYDEILVFDDNHYTLTSGFKKGLYSKSVQKLIVPVEYDEIDQFVNQMCAAKQGNILIHYDIFGNIKK